MSNRMPLRANSSNRTAARLQPNSPQAKAGGTIETVSPTTHHRVARLRTDANTSRSHTEPGPEGTPNRDEGKPQPNRSRPAVELIERRYRCRSCTRRWVVYGGKYPDLRCVFCHSPHIKGKTA